MTSAADRIRIVLVGTTHAGNIGAAARAMKVMGLHRLYLVAPQGFPSSVATAMAAGADDILAAAAVVDNFGDAVADCQLVMGTTARRRSLPKPLLPPRLAAQRAVDESVRHEVALVFGREKSGLSNDEASRCNALINIPTSDSYSSLNLAQAVQIMAYEARLAMLEEPPSEVAPADWEPAEIGRLEVFIDRLEQCLFDIRFLVPGQSTRLMQRLRRLFLRARPDDNELNILNGIVSAIRRTADEPPQRQKN
ncbi:MAG TPA: RNA methyltransferase [Wenzhouxiangella sp.]|nr:RNA methyltransferase [Wenzhouxiangella sp.]